MPTYHTAATPNPNSLKLTTDAGAFVEDGMLSFSSAREAEGHPLGRRLFAVDGVANVFAVPSFLTITKTPDADWNAILPAAEEALDAYFAERDA
jgi:hypothetical protein